MRVNIVILIYLFNYNLIINTFAVLMTVAEEQNCSKSSLEIGTREVVVFAVKIFAM
jgi:hypothetical protein